MNNIINFWAALRDPAGGFYGLADADGRVDTHAPKGCILNSRILWFFSKAERREEAEHAYNFLRDKFCDRDNGGLFWSVNADGTPLDDQKHIYCQAFGLYALAAYHKLSGDQTALDLANELFDTIERIGYREAFTRDWKPRANEQLSENGVEAARTMNTLLHIFEAYAEFLPRGGERVKTAMLGILQTFKTKIFNPQKRRLEVFFDENYNSLIDLQSYGHDIEASWLLDWGADMIGEKLDFTQTLAESVYDRAYSDNSLFNECENGADDRRRIWWVQAEAVLGFENAHKKSGDPKFAAAAEAIKTYIAQKLTHPSGEWFESVSEDGTPSRKPLADPWKCPYHNGRMYLLGR